MMILRVLLCVALLASLTADAKAARKRQKEPVIVTPPTLVERAQAIRSSLERQARDPQLSLEQRARTALRVGMVDVADSCVAQLFSTDSATAFQLRGARLLQTYRFAGLPPVLGRLSAVSRSFESRWLEYRWRFMREDLTAVDSLSQADLARDPSDLAAQTARAELAHRLLNYAEAESRYRDLLSHAPDPAARSRAAVGLARALYKQDRYQAALDTLLTLMDSTTLSDDALAAMGLSLIALTRVNEAIELLDEATRWNPWNEQAQYYLGNGYSRQNYTQLRGKNNDVFPAEAAQSNLQARQLIASRRLDDALDLCRMTAAAAVRDPESRMLLGAIFWELGELDSAEVRFRESLSVLSGYGRARNGLARTLEGMRLRWNAHRAADSTAFTQTPLPDVPRISEFVINWHSLSPRHQKQVALSIEPWKAYLPVLIECGSRYYIKPLYELLSECPNQETLRDLRIDLDSRLWDDVRGCGGFTTVTGLEDVERGIFRGYNTVLHELTHQVHGVFPPADADRIRDLYHAARSREDKGTPTFLSRYQQSTVWEYFAEGANAYFSPRRDAYDTRDIVRERLMERDTALAAAVRHYAAGPNLSACYPIGLVNAAENALERRRTDDALLFAAKAFARAPQSEAVLEELVRIHSILDRDSLALSYADSFLFAHARRASPYKSKAMARFFSDGKNDARIEILTAAVAAVDSSERKSVRLALGKALWYAGRYAESARQYRLILDEVRDDADALWGLAVAHGDAGEIAAADSAFREAIARRSGIVELRLDYARILLQAGRLEDAAVQLEEAQLLARGDPMVIALKGWYTARRGNYKEALRLLDRAADLAPDLRLTWILRLDVRKHYTPPKRRDAKRRDPLSREAAEIRAMEQHDVPVWIFNERTASYVEARVWPQFQRDLLKQVCDGL